MKFTDGYWMTRKGYQLLSPYEIHDVTTRADSITVYATHRHLADRANTLNEPLMTMEFSSPLPDIIRVKFYHHKGTVRKGPSSFDLLPKGNVPVAIENNEEFVSLTSGDTKVTITKQNPVKITYTHKGKKLTGSGTRSTAYVKAENGNHHFREQLSLSVGETVYGLGERFTPFVKTGKSSTSGTKTEVPLPSKLIKTFLSISRTAVMEFSSTIPSWSLSRSVPKSCPKPSSACKANVWSIT